MSHRGHVEGNIPVDAPANATLVDQHASPTDERSFSDHVAVLSQEFSTHLQSHPSPVLASPARLPEPVEPLERSRQDVARVMDALSVQYQLSLEDFDHIECVSHGTWLMRTAPETPPVAARQ